MPRPRLRRRLCIQPDARYYKPCGIPLRQLQTITLHHEELEALWLVDLKQREQADAARHMNTSQSTIQRILRRARAKVADALVSGKAISLIDEP